MTRTDERILSVHQSTFHRFFGEFQTTLVNDKRFLSRRSHSLDYDGLLSSGDYIREDEVYSIVLVHVTGNDTFKGYTFHPFRM